MSVKVRRERPDQRRHHRITAPLVVSVGGYTARASDWSLGGLKIVDFTGELPAAGSQLDLQLTLPFQGFDVSFSAKGAVIRNVPEQRMFSVRFTELGERERELMSHFLEELVRGAMVEIEDTIQRIDVPVTPASLEPDVKPATTKANLPLRRWPVQAMVMTGIYGVLGLFILSYASLLVFSNFFRMEVQTAVIAAPVETVQAQTDGRLVWSGRKPGEEVKAGEVLVRVVDSQLEREIELAEIAVQERKARLVSLKQKHVEELERLRGYAAIEMKNVQQTKLELEALQAQLQLAERNEWRLRTLRDKGFATDSKLDEAARQVITLKKELEVRRVELASRIDLSQQNFGKRLYSGNELIGQAELSGKAADIEADIRLEENEIKLAQQRHLAALSVRNERAVRAPFDGTLLDLPRVDNGSVRRGDTIAIIEQRKSRHVVAYLNQDEVLKVGLGDEALIYLPAVGETVKGRVSKIDRTSGFLVEQDHKQNPGYGWRGPSDRSAKVLISFNDVTKVADHERYRAGLPAVVVFERRSTNSLVAALRKQFALAL